MTVSNFPTLKPIEPTTFGLVFNTRVHTSPFDGFTQTVELPGAHFYASVTLGVDLDDRRVLQAFLDGLHGAAGRFYYGDPYYLREGPQGPRGGTPLVDGAGQTGTSLATKGWSAATMVLKKGDYVHFTNGDGGRELKRLTADATTDGSGDVTLAFEPPIRVAPDDEAAIEADAARGQFRLIDDRQGVLPLHRLGSGPVTVEMIEAFHDGA